MKPIKALIVEDNAFMATVLNDLLTQHATDIAVLNIAKNYLSIKKLSKNKVGNIYIPIKKISLLKVLIKSWRL